MGKTFYIPLFKVNYSYPNAGTGEVPCMAGTFAMKESSTNCSGFHRVPSGFTLLRCTYLPMCVCWAYDRREQRITEVACLPGTFATCDVVVSAPRTTMAASAAPVHMCNRASAEHTAERLRCSATPRGDRAAALRGGAAAGRAASRSCCATGR